jgi:hypothetical protein
MARHLGPSDLLMMAVAAEVVVMVMGLVVSSRNIGCIPDITMIYALSYSHSFSSNNSYSLLDRWPFDKNTCFSSQIVLSHLPNGISRLDNLR